MSTNPYASPRSHCPPAKRADEQDPRRQMRLVIRLYWWMGVIGVAAYSVLSIGLCLDWAIRRGPAPDYATGLLFAIAAIAVFASSINVARRLATRPEGVLRRARLVGLILATAWFPILTVPGIICVRRVTRYFDAYCDLMQADAGNTMTANKA